MHADVLLTGALDGHFELSSTGSFGVNLEVGRLLHPQALRLQAAALSSAQVGVTGCGETREFSCGFSREEMNEVQGERY